MPAPEQTSLLDPGLVAPAPAATRFAAVAQVLVDMPLPHLDHTFDYGIPDALDAAAQPGVRVKVRFAGTDRDGYLIARTSGTTHTGALAPLRKVVSPLPVLTPAVHELARTVAKRYAGTSTDVLRLAIPPRHATAEKAVLAQPEAVPELPASAPEVGSAVGQAPLPDPTGADVVLDADRLAHWADYPGGAAFLRRIGAGDSPRAAWCALPGRVELGGTEHPHWAVAVAVAVLATRAGRRDAIVSVPDARDVATLGAALDALDIEHVVLTAEQGASARYRRFVRALTGRTHVVIGTRSAAFAPLPNLGLVVCWDDGDDLLAEPRAPYPHTREVLVQRADLAGAAALVGGFARTPEAQLLVADGWARSLQADRSVVRARAPRVIAPGEADLAREGEGGRARIPAPALALARRALANGPVLVQVPRAGYLPVVACARCRTPARCSHCHGPLRLDRADAPPQCRWCGRHATAWACGECGATAMRAMRTGAGRTAEELGRAFPGVPVTVSGRDGGVLDRVPAGPRLVVATPGAEPSADGGYTGALLLDAALITNRPELSAGVEALRRWLGAAALVRSSGDGGEVMILGQGAPVPVQALVRWDPVGHAGRELSERQDLSFPPLVRLATLTGGSGALASMMRHLRLPAEAEVLGPVPVEDTGGPAQGAEEEMLRTLVRIDRRAGDVLSVALAQAQAIRSARKEPGVVRVRIDPDHLW
ncbi:primosomal protein N' [Occultella aeris]|uniref:Probable replication restart protein PriA n=1 Tax=Occultella aeris TaxID=2761496 RepID=A0A7M4DSY6_9MICO|nr:primosomal protein N' [Occultella aeris]VZO40580.1 Primosomal protein N' [Occultella aeris]